MSSYEKNEIIAELEMLKIILDFHTQNKDKVLMTKLEFEEYVNSI
jgi:hypothetical protein